MDLNLLGESFGDRAVCAPFAAVVTGTAAVDGIKRAMFGGVVLADIGTEHWQRWRGTLIFMPRIIDKTRRTENGTLQQLMLGRLNDMSKERDSFWVPTWRAK